MRGGLLLLACAALLALPASAGARVVRSVSILPPGQSGFVSAPGLADGTGSPHLYDQTQPFIDFRWKPATFNLPGRVENPRDGIRIVRDSFGVPAVTGRTEDLMWRGAGYAMAQDRLFELELFRRATTGTLASIAGRERVPDDRVVRQGFYTAAELDRMYTALPENFRRRFEAYRDGVNDWIDHVTRSPSDMPGEFAAVGIAVPDRWTVRDSLAIGVYLARTIPVNADPSGLELANLRGLQLGGVRALNALVPLRTPGALPTIPAREGRFPSQPGRTLRQERAALARSAAYARGLPFPAGAPADPTSPRAVSARSPATRILGVGGSWMFAVRDPARRRTWLYNGPQLGFTAPERVVELELHAPGIDARGMTAPGVPVLGNGHNGRVAWGITSGASDVDDLYAERTVPGDPESYRFRGQVRRMDCRNETIVYRSPPSSLIGLVGGRVPPAPESGSETIRVCRTHHGPVEARAGDVAYARRHSIWGRELDTLAGLDALMRARNIREVDTAVRMMTWNENVMAADSAGNIGFWHPGLHPLRPRAWDERLPYPGTGEAEWRGIRSPIPAVINPRQRWLANWNNLPSAGWTSGDGTARKRMDGGYFRVAALMPAVRALARQPSFDGMVDVVRQVGTTAQQHPPARRRLRVAARPPVGRRAAVVLNTLLAWDGSYHRTDSRGTVHPGVATWDAFRAELDKLVRARIGPAAGWLANEGALQFLTPGYHQGAPYHYFEATHLESTGLRTLDTAAWRLAAERTYEVLARRFGSADPGRWREPRRMFDFQGLAGAQPPPLPFFDRGTFEELIELGP